MRVTRLVNTHGDVRVVAGWRVGVDEAGVMVVGSDGGTPEELPPIVCVGTAGIVRLSATNPPPVYDGWIWEAHIYAARHNRAVPVLEPERHPTATTLVRLDASVVAVPKSQAALVWRPLLGEPRRRVPEFYVEADEVHGDDLVIDRRIFQPLNGGFAERAIASLGKWEALELVEVHESTLFETRALESGELKASLGEVAQFAHPAGALPLDHHEQKGVLLMESGRRLMWIKPDHWTSWAPKNLPARFRNEVRGAPAP